MEISIGDNIGPYCVIAVSGRLNAVSAPSLKAEIKKQIEAKNSRLLIDLAATSFIDTSGLSTLVSGLKMVREVGGGLRLSGLNEQTLAVFKMTMLDRVFEIFPTKEDAAKE